MKGQLCGGGGLFGRFLENNFLQGLNNGHDDGISMQESHFVLARMNIHVQGRWIHRQIQVNERTCLFVDQHGVHLLERLLQRLTID